jgi:hypothetical protein
VPIDPEYSAHLFTETDFSVRQLDDVRFQVIHSYSQCRPRLTGSGRRLLHVGLNS